MESFILEASQLDNGLTESLSTTPVTRFKLYNSATNTFIQDLLQESTLLFDANYTLVYQPEVINNSHSVEFLVDGNSVVTENSAPYCISGDTNGDFKTWANISKNTTITVTAKEYSGANKQGSIINSETIKLTFSTLPGPTPTPTPIPIPSPVTDAINILQVHTNSVPVYETLILDIETDTVLSETLESTFTNYRLSSVFKHSSGETVIVYGFFNGDGQPEITSATAGRFWRVLFRPDLVGVWQVDLYFQTGPNLGVELATLVQLESLDSRFQLHCDVTITTATILPIAYQGTHQLLDKAGKPFFKFGLDSPENFLGYYEFDNVGASHHYAPHAQDYDHNTGAAYLWAGKGKNILGAINYMQKSQINSQYMILMNVKGDGKDVFPWVTQTNYRNFDISKLAQWFKVFSYMNTMGVMCHYLLQETENCKLLNSGEMGLDRKLYYKEMINRFSHFKRVLWNNCEESTPIKDQQAAHIQFLYEHNAYQQPIVTHCHPGSANQADVYNVLLSSPYLSGASIQAGSGDEVNSVIRWLKNSNYKWIVGLDEEGPANTGIHADVNDFWHDGHRTVLWKVLLSGGYGMEYYFGYQQPHTDLNCEDFRSRDHFYKLAAHAQTLLNRIKNTHDMRLFKPNIVDAGGLLSYGSNQCILVGFENTAKNINNIPAAITHYSWFNTVTGQSSVSVPVTSHTAPFTQNFIPSFTERPYNSILVLEGASVPIPTPESDSVVDFIAMIRTIFCDPAVKGVDFKNVRMSGQISFIDSNEKL